MSVVIPIKPIPSWSFSRLSVFEQCRMRAKLAYIDRIPEPERPLPPGKTEHANDRGTRIHTGAELFVQSKGAFLTEMEKFRLEFEALKRLYQEGKVSLEGEWGMDHNWAPCDWRTAWQRLKIDVLVFLSKFEAVVIDYKTGKKFGNEIKHAEQTQLYALNTFLRYPDLEEIHTELWYLDQPHDENLTRITFTRAQALRFRQNWDRRATTMTTTTEFPPNPSIFTCKWCPYGQGENKTGDCKRGL